MQKNSQGQQLLKTDPKCLGRSFLQISRAPVETDLSTRFAKMSVSYKCVRTFFCHSPENSINITISHRVSRLQFWNWILCFIIAKVLKKMSKGFAKFGAKIYLSMEHSQCKKNRKPLL